MFDALLLRLTKDMQLNGSSEKRIMNDVIFVAGVIAYVILDHRIKATV